MNFCQQQQKNETHIYAYITEHKPQTTEMMMTVVEDDNDRQVRPVRFAIIDIHSIFNDVHHSLSF